MPARSPSSAPLQSLATAQWTALLPDSAPVTARAIRPMGAVLAGVCGSLSTTSSPIAKSVKYHSGRHGVHPAQGVLQMNPPQISGAQMIAGGINRTQARNTSIRKQSRSTVKTITHVLSGTDLQRWHCPPLHAERQNLSTADRARMFRDEKQKFRFDQLYPCMRSRWYRQSHDHGLPDWRE